MINVAVEQLKWFQVAENVVLRPAPGESEGIVAGVSGGFLLMAIVVILLCFFKEDV